MARFRLWNIYKPNKGKANCRAFFLPFLLLFGSSLGVAAARQVGKVFGILISNWIKVL